LTGRWERVVANVGGVNAAARDVQVLFDAGTVAGLSDGQLLERFVARREEVVFEALVRRHGPMVWGTCRRVLRDHHDAEDAFQATFLVLARKAASVVPREKVGHWLYGVACQTAMKSRATRARRRGKEVPVSDIPEPAAVRSNPLDDLLPDLDQELSRLPEKYRIPIVLCELEGMTHREAGEELGWPVGTVSGRLSRAKAMLGRRLARHGVATSAGSMAVLLAGAREAASASMETGLIGPTARVARVFATGRATSAGMVSAEVASLTREVLNTMLQIKIKFVASVLFLGLALAVGGTCLAYRAQVAGDPGREETTASAKVQVERIEEQQPEAAKPQSPPAKAKDQAADQMASYPFKIDPEDVYEFSELTIDYREFHLKTGPVSVVPISTERGITGVMVIGNGTFRNAPEKGKVFEGQSRAVMLRFNPEEQPAIVPLEKGKRVRDLGILEMSRQLLQVVIRHCWQSSKDGGRRQEVLIPPKGSFAAVLYTKEHGDLLISGDERIWTIFNFTDRKTLYEKK
jgi:RNA polymerase sigma factor (sigma-70 family)